MVHFLWKVGDWFAKWKEGRGGGGGGGGGGAAFTCQGLFFILDSQVIQIFRLNRLIILRVGGCVFKLRGINREIIGWPSS